MLSVELAQGFAAELELLHEHLLSRMTLRRWTAWNSCRQVIKTLVTCFEGTALHAGKTRAQDGP